MKTTKAILDGKEIDVVIQIDDNDIEIFEPINDDEKTIDLTEILDNTQRIEIGDINE